MAINEFCMSVDDFLNPVVLKNEEAIATLLSRLILLEPGTIQSHPDMGVGIISRYRYSNVEEARKLKADIQQQVSKFLPDYSNVPFSVTASKNSGFYITAEINGSLYGIEYDTNNKKLNTRYQKISEL